QYAEALDAFRQATQANPTYASAYYSAGVIFVQQQQYTDARRVLDYARTLFEAQGNEQWASQTVKLLEDLPQ
ncbi:MAG: tetratricopeptide repeat protein, partial [Cyanobacteria bacterium P01_A01_bin.135]